MKVYLEAFVDTNFGDNLFVHTVISQYPQHTFYMLEREGYEEAYRILEKHEPCVHIIRSTDTSDWFADMEAMMLVGGDIFGAHTDYAGLLSKVKRMKAQGGLVFFLGLSLLESYTDNIQYYLKLLFTWADCIVVRETSTYHQVKQIAPVAKVTASTDMAFVTDVSSYKNGHIEKGLLGISVRKKIPRNGTDAYVQYCRQIAKAVTYYLEQQSDRRVRFLALSSGVYDDAEVAREIISYCPVEYHSRMSCSAFDGDIDGYIRELQACETLVCTRFHALVFALLLQKPFLPIVYEEKTKRLLLEIGYEGNCISYEATWEADIIEQTLSNVKIDPNMMQQYLEQAKDFFKLPSLVFKCDRVQRKIQYLNKKLRTIGYRVKHKLER